MKKRDISLFFSQNFIAAAVKKNFFLNRSRETMPAHPHNKSISDVVVEANMVPYVTLPVPNILQQRNIGPCVNFNKDGDKGGMVPHRQNVIRCLDTQPLPSEAAVKHDYNVPQSIAVVELQNAIVVFNQRE